MRGFDSPFPWFPWFSWFCKFNFFSHLRFKWVIMEENSFPGNSLHGRCLKDFFALHGKHKNCLRLSSLLAFRFAIIFRSRKRKKEIFYRKKHFQIQIRRPFDSRSRREIFLCAWELRDRSPLRFFFFLLWRSSWKLRQRRRLRNRRYNFTSFPDNWKSNLFYRHNEFIYAMCNLQDKN